MEQELKKIYDSEINIRITSMWDGGYSVSIGDTLNGFIPEEEVYGLKLEEIVSELQKLIKTHLPDSTYAKSL